MPSLLATLGLDATSFQAKLNESQKLAGKAGQQMGQSLLGPLKMGLGAMAGAMVLKFAKDMVNSAGHFKDLADQFRTSAEAVQQWDIAARKAGMRAEDIGTALVKLKKAREEAVESGSLGGFKEFGISMEALRDASISTEQILRRMAEVTSGGLVTEAQDVAGMELMGKSGARILAAFDELHKLGPVKLIDDDTVAKLDEADEKLEELGRKTKVLFANAYTAAVESPKALWKAAKDLAGPAFRSGQQGPVFGGEGSDPFGGFTVTSSTGPDNLHKPAIQGKTKKELEELAKLQATLAEKVFQNALKTMTVEERRAELNRQITEHQLKARRAGELDDEKTALEEKLKAEELLGQLAGVKDAKTKGGSSADVNALQRIGAYSAGISGTDKAILEIRNDVKKMADRSQEPRQVEGF